jgi:predicted Zn finger-like uncharacterized protein
MILTCPQCSTRYQIDDAKFPADGRTVRCAKCGHQWFQQAPRREPEPETTPAVTEAPSTPASPPPPPPPASPPPQPGPEALRRAAFTAPATAPARRESVGPRAAPGERLSIAAGWIALAAILLLIVWGAVRYRDAIASAWPQSSSFYAALGMPVNARGLSFTGVSYRRDTEAGQLVLTVNGNLVNVSSREIAVPEIEVVLSDNDRHRLDRWVFSPGVPKLKPGQRIAFTTRRTNPPPDARHLEMSFADAGS